MDIEYLFTQIGHVTDGLYVGSILATNPVVLERLNINCVVNLCGSKSYEMNNVEYTYIELEDNVQSSHKLMPIFEDILPKIRKWIENGKNVFVCCSAGKSRSVSVVMAYLIKYGHVYSAKDALELVRENRRVANPNPGFMDILTTLSSAI